MSPRTLLTALFISLTLVACSSGSGGDDDLQAATTDMSGSWRFAISNTSGDVYYGWADLSQSGNSLSGSFVDTYGYSSSVSGTISGSSLDITLSGGGDTTWVDGSLNPSNLNQCAGDWRDSEGDSGSWLGERASSTGLEPDGDG